MARGIGILSLLASLVVGSLLFSSQLGGQATTAHEGAKAVHDAQLVGATFAARPADSILAAFRATSGTFAGADVSSVPGVRLLHADALTYCLAIAQDGTTFYERGPRGTVATQPC